MFVAEAGASAALAGLLFVALSINLERILKGSGLPGRAGEAIVLLLTVLVVSTFGLVPGQSPRVLGAEVLGFGLLPWLILIGIHVDAVRRHAGPSRGFLVRRIVLAQGAVLPLLIAGVSLLLVTGPRPLLAGPRHRALPGGGGVGCVGTARRDPSVTTSPVLHGFHLGVTGLMLFCYLRHAGPERQERKPQPAPCCSATTIDRR